MKTLYLECNAGASGDMILGALTDLLKDSFEFKQMIESAGIPGVAAEVEVDEQSAVAGIRVHIKVDGVEEGDGNETSHRDSRVLGDVVSLIGELNVSDMVKDDASQIYRIIAEAESNVHGKPVSEVHFHEVGALDAIADIVGVCMLIERLSPAQIIASSLRTGFGSVKCAHGILPVPAPATAYILRGMPVYAGDEEGEFTTPTGAAIVRHFAEKYGQMPLMKFDDVGYGLGKKTFRTANMVRAYFGDVDGIMPTVKEISCNIDDMTPEDIGGIVDLLMASGALDATIASAVMKKSRPGFILSCICREEDADDLATVILAHTSSIGLRMHTCERYEMASSFITYRTDFGDVRIKISEGYGLRKWKPEYKDLVKAAVANGVTVDEVRKNIRFDPDEELGDD